MCKSEVSPPVSTNDHCTVACFLNFRLKKDPVYSRIVWQYNKANFIELNEALTYTDFDECFVSNDIDEVCHKWTETVLNAARSHIPNKVVTIRPNDSPWYDNTLRHMKRSLQRIFHRYKRTKLDRD